MNSDLFKKLFTEEHRNNLPFVRIIEAELENFKSVEYGNIVFNCGKEKVPYNTKSDILGIYGQNGSGKTSFIEALDILRILMSGGSIPNYYADCIAKGKEYSKLSFTFDFQYPNNIIRTVKYEFKLRLIDLDSENGNIGYENEAIEIEKKSYLQVFDEIVSVAGKFEGKNIKMQSIIDTSLQDGIFGPVTKRKFFVDPKYKFSDLENDFFIYKKLALEKSQSFIFMDKVLSIFKEKGSYSDFFQVLLEMKNYASFLLRIIRIKDSGFIRLGLHLPVYFQFSDVPVFIGRGTVVSKDLYEKFDKLFSNMNLVLRELIPNIDIKLKKLSPALLKSGEEGFYVDIVSIRNGIEFPIRVESDGIRKLISSLSLIIAAFNEPHLTIAIDEFDAGIFEYLLGEILEIFETYGKGQFIFTSHNLRPLEVINKNFLIFTTVNPQNRYVRMKNIYPTHNLRDRYYHEILINEQDEILYKQSKDYKIIQVLKKASDIDDVKGMSLLINKR